jgi:hypothetical protein
MNSTKYDSTFKLIKLFEQNLPTAEGTGSQSQRDRHTAEGAFLMPWDIESMFDVWNKNIISNASSVLLMYSVGSDLVPNENEQAQQAEKIISAGLGLIHSIHRVRTVFSKILLAPEYTFDTLDYSIRLHLNSNKFVLPIDPSIDPQVLIDNFIHMIRQGRVGTKFESIYPIPEEEQIVQLDQKIKLIGTNLWNQVSPGFKYLTILYQTSKEIFHWIAIPSESSKTKINLVGYVFDLESNGESNNLTVHWLG